MSAQRDQAVSYSYNLAKMNYFIDLVRREPSLYDCGHPDYCNRFRKALIWAKIAKETKYKNGNAAKDAWIKLRNCHRDAMRRKHKLNKSDSTFIPKRWKYEKQMEFLLSHMNSRATMGHTSVETSNQTSATQSEDAKSCPDSEFDAEFEQSGMLVTEESYQNLKTSPSTSLEVSSPQLHFPYESQVHIPQPPSIQEMAITKPDLRPSTFISHQMRPSNNSYNKNQGDEMRHFFDTMYVITKNMPALSRHKLRRGIFNLVSDEEECLIRSGLMPSDTHLGYGNNESAPVTDPIASPTQSPVSPSPSHT